jgi:hypothetical protein
LRIRHFRDDDEVVLTKREIQVEQLAAGVLAKLRDRSLLSSGFANPPLMYSRVKRPCVMKIAMSNLPMPALVVRPDQP